MIKKTIPLYVVLDPLGSTSLIGNESYKVRVWAVIQTVYKNMFGVSSDFSLKSTTVEE